MRPTHNLEHPPQGDSVAAWSHHATRMADNPAHFACGQRAIDRMRSAAIVEERAARARQPNSFSGARHR